MGFSHVFELVAILLQVVFLEGILSLDNAAVLGAIVLGLPADQEVPWPKSLVKVGKALNKVFGKQRTAGLRVGLLGAYLGRGLMLVMASFVVRNEWLQLVGALYLLKISVAELGKLHHEHSGTGEDDLVKKFEYRSFWSTVLMVELMDLAFSLDNVVVVVTLSRELWLIMLGVAFGILTMRFAAGIFSKLIEKVPTLSIGAYVLVFNIGLEFIISRLFETEIPNYVRFSINIGILILAYVFNQFPALTRMMKWPFRIAQYIMFAIDRVFAMVVFPFAWLFRQLGRLLSSGRKKDQVVAESSEAGH